MAPCSIRGSARSCRKRVRPVAFSTPSFFGVPLPITAKPGALTRSPSTPTGATSRQRAQPQALVEHGRHLVDAGPGPDAEEGRRLQLHELTRARSEEHTSELQSLRHLV